MNIVRDKRTITLKDKHIKRIAYGLREVLVKATLKEWSRLGIEKRKKGKLQLELNRIEDERSILYGALDDSICFCAGCSHTDRNMVYKAPLKAWYLYSMHKWISQFLRKGIWQEQERLILRILLLKFRVSRFLKFSIF